MLQKKPDNKLSVILITKNEGHNLKECLASINFAHEIIIVDSGSTDNTVLIGRQAGAKVIEQTTGQDLARKKSSLGSCKRRMDIVN